MAFHPEASSTEAVPCPPAPPRARRSLADPTASSAADIPMAIRLLRSQRRGSHGRLVASSAEILPDPTLPSRQRHAHALVRSENERRSQKQLCVMPTGDDTPFPCFMLVPGITSTLFAREGT